MFLFPGPPAQATINDAATNWFWLESGTGWLYSFITHFQAAAPNVPSVVSISYAWSEQDQCNAGVVGPECSQLGVDTQGYVLRVNVEYVVVHVCLLSCPLPSLPSHHVVVFVHFRFAKLAAMGISVLSASGDSGAHGRTDPDCTAPVLHPDFPASSPWVTSVGATMLVNATLMPNPPPICTLQNCILKGPNGTEVAVSYDVAGFTSGGGFSWYAAQPNWQAAAVTRYLTSSAARLPPASFFNASGRAYPDIAALGHNFLIQLTADGEVQPVGGTSVAAPVVASLVALLNQVSVAKSGKTLGFVSPLLFHMFATDPSIFQDVVLGDNVCTEDGCDPACVGFQAAPGWDPVTGLGTLNVAKAMAFIGNLLDQRAAARA